MIAPPRQHNPGRGGAASGGAVQAAAAIAATLNRLLAPLKDGVHFVPFAVLRRLGIVPYRAAEPAFGAVDAVKVSFIREAYNTVRTRGAAHQRGNSAAAARIARSIVPTLDRLTGISTARGSGGEG